MFSNNKSSNNSNDNVVSTVIGPMTTIRGDLQFSGGLLVEGRVIGDVSSSSDDESLLILEESGHIEGEVTVHNIIVNGHVTGDIHVSGQAELSANAVINGTVYYDKLEMVNGARINGSLVHQQASVKQAENPAADPAIDTAALKNT